MFAPIALLLVATTSSPTGSLQKFPMELREHCAIRYSTVEADVAAKIVVFPKPYPVPQGHDAEQITSPQGTSRLMIIRPDTTHRGPWNTSVVLTPRATDPITLEFRDHDQAGVGGHWINEKLVYLQVFWGRTWSTDLIFDTSAHRFIYQEMANYAYTWEPECREIVDLEMHQP